MNISRDERSWAAAASRASFAWFAPVEPRPLHIWAGGYGWDPRGPSTLEVLAVCDGVEMSVETRVDDDGLADGVGQRLMVYDWIWHSIADGIGPLSLPMTIVLEPDDRTIVVDGSEISFAGVRLDGSDRWTGMAKVGDVSVKIITAASIPSLAIGSSRDTGLPESPPP